MSFLETPRLRFRRFRESDLQHLESLEADPEVVRYTPMAVPLASLRIRERLLDLIAREQERSPLGVWAVETKEAEFVGWFMLLKAKEPDPELGFMIRRDQWGKGYATEAARRLVDFALYDLGYSAVLGTVRRENVASARVLEKLGFQRTGSRMEPAASGPGEVAVDLYVLWG